MKRDNVLAAIILLLLTISPLYSWDYTIIGKVVNSETKEPVAAAGVKVDGTTKGTYTNHQGIFRLNLIRAEHKLIINSIGYKRNIVSLAKDYSQDTLRIYLQPKDITTKEVIAIGEIEPDEIIKRAIAKKKDNQNKINTVNAVI